MPGLRVRQEGQEEDVNAESLAREIITVAPGDGGWKVYLFGDLVHWCEREEFAATLAESWRQQLEAAIRRQERIERETC